MRFLTVLAILGLTITMAGSPGSGRWFCRRTGDPLGQSPVGPRAGSSRSALCSQSPSGYVPLPTQLLLPERRQVVSGENHGRPLGLDPGSTPGFLPHPGPLLQEAPRMGPGKENRLAWCSHASRPDEEARIWLRPHSPGASEKNGSVDLLR